MLEQKDLNKSVIEESDDINNKSVGQKEELIDIDNQNSNDYKSIKPNFIDTFKANLIDLVVIGGISTVAVFVADALLRLAGYFITQKFQMTFIIFMVVMVLYMSIMESGKKSSTLGKKISGLIITKG
ncbi:RDD family protein [Clostridium estertheticum]|uniref:RDD family protein n=1 Tax=Clostridium estertheticum TaxID=238834 RepID=UPI0013E914B0|nr:RDD family protein [Clostridium estertheticum]MBZ9688135.1 RDD family protein [Clostridium estertheticum]